MIKAVPFKPEHLEGMTLKQCHAGEGTGEITTSAFTLLSGDSPIGCVGWFMVAPTVLQAWALFSEQVKASPIAFHKAIMSLVKFGFETTATRIQFSVRCDFEEGFDWAVALGFNCEGIMKSYATDGSDCWLFARTKPCIS